MSSDESQRAEILARVAVGVLTLKQAAQLLDVSYRQARRLAQRYQRDGLGGLVHGHRGHRSNRAKPVELREQALEFIRRSGCGPFGPALAAAELERHVGVRICHETLRRWMLEAGLWSGSRKAPQVPSVLAEPAQFGELLLMGGRPCSWPQERRVVNWLARLLDARTQTMTLRVTRDPIWAMVGVLRAWVEQYGVPRAVQVDWRSLGVPQRNGSESAASGSVAAQLRRMCSMLSISLLDGRRPQGSGSYLDEHWDLIVEEFRARTITSDKQANAFLDRIYLPARNRAVTASPADSENAHRRIPEGLALDVVFRLEEERPIREDWTVPYRGRLYQVRRESRYAPARARVVVYETADGRVEIFYRGRAVTSRALSGWQSARERGRPKTYGHSGRTFLSSESRDISKE